MEKCYKRGIKCAALAAVITMQKGTEIIKDKKGNTVAIIVYNDYQKEGVNFFTPGELSQQLAFISHKSGKIIGAHLHNVCKRDILVTQETLFIKKGKLKVNFYDNDKKFFDSRVLEAGDVALLAGGGHGFEVLEDVDMIEVKQGPYIGDEYKDRFKGIEK